MSTCHWCLRKMSEETGPIWKGQREWKYYGLGFGFFVWVFFHTSVIPLLLASLPLHGQFSDLLTVCWSARDTTKEVTRTCNWGGIVSSGPNLNVVYLQPESTVCEIIQEKCSEGIEVRGQCSMAFTHLVFGDWGISACLPSTSMHSRANLSTEDAAVLGSRLTGNHSPDACSVHWSWWEPYQHSCWLHWEDEVGGFSGSLHSHPI